MRETKFWVFMNMSKFEIFETNWVSSIQYN